MSDKMLRIALIGKTGAGKSKTGNTILNLNTAKPSAFKSSSQGKSVTTVSESRHDTVLNRCVSVTDTPGFLDNRVESQKTILNEIARCIYVCSPGPHAIIHVTEIGRFTSEDVDAIDEFVKLFGDELYKYICIIFTRFDDLKRDWIEMEENKSEKEKEEEKKEGKKKLDISSHVQTLPATVREFIEIKCRGRVLAFDNTLRGSEAEAQVQSLFSLIDVLLKENNGLHYTNEDFNRADEIQKKEMEKEKERLEKKLKDELEEKQKAIEKAADEIARQQIKKEMENFKVEMKHKMDMDNLRAKAQNSNDSFEKFKTYASLFQSAVGIMKCIR